MAGDGGPRLVVGHVSHREARIWGRGDANHPVMFVAATGPDGERHQDVVSLSAADGYSGVAELEGLKSSTRYQLQVDYGSSRESGPEQLGLSRQGSLKTFPAPEEDRPFTLLLNSCNFHGWGPIRNNHKASQRRAELAQGVDLVIHAGDQVYADKAPMSFTLGDFRKAYYRTWGDPSTQQLLGSQANYMVADDHEVLNGFSLDGKLTGFQRALLWLRGQGGPAAEQYQELLTNGVKAFDEFQSAHSPKSHGSQARYFNFSHGQHQFFAMDTRFERRHNQMISEGQREALFQWLTEHRDQPKFIITSSPFVIENVDPAEKWSGPEFSSQRHEIIEFLAKEKLDNVAFLCGDIHASAHAEMKIAAPDGTELTIHELCASPINGTLQRGRDQFRGTSSGQTPNGTRYQMSLDEPSFLGEGRWGDISNSAVMRVQVNGDEVRFETHRTRKNDDGPIRQGSFKI